MNYRISFLVILCCTHTLVGIAAPLADKLNYPAAPRDSVVDDYYGTPVSDPYRWLEDTGSRATTDWVRAQSRLAREYLDRLPDRDAIRMRLTELWNYPRTEVPWRESGHVFFEDNSGLQLQSVLYMLPSIDAKPRVVFDPNEISPDGSIAIQDFAVSPDGRWLAYSCSRGGADIAETRVRDLSSGREQGDVVPGTWSNACWTYDGGGFFYMRPPALKPGQTSASARIAKQLFYHVLGQPAEADRMIHEWESARWLYTMMSDDGRRAIVVIEQGSNSWMYTIDLGNAMAPDVSAPLLSLLGDTEANYTPMGTVGDTLFAFSDLGAPRGRVIALDLSEGPDARPREVVAESDDVIRGATVAGDRLVVHYLRDVRSRLQLFALDGQPAGEIALPGIGAVGWALNGRNSAPELWYSFASFLAPETVYRYDMATRTSAPFRAANVPFAADAYETRQVFYASKDGTRVPMFITARKGMARDASAPTFLTAYGGYGSTMAPDYRPDIPLWLEMGGIYAVANIRGGGEYGEEWHRAGNLERKQNSFDDFIAAAEYLVAERYTVPGKIAIYGHSNGGLLIGAVVTQRPDLFAVALANAGHHDMLRYQKFTVGAGWVSEYGSSDNADEFRYLFAYSPLHNVHQGTCYPATMLLTGDHDDRVVPSHSYKFAAALQAAQGCDRPILLRIASDASHSYSSEAASIDELSDAWAFVAACMGVSVHSR